jgi:hypothetical protein
MWNKKIDKSWTPFDGVVHWLRIWFLIRKVKGSILNTITYVNASRAKVGKVG